MALVHLGVWELLISLENSSFYISLSLDSTVQWGPPDGVDPGGCVWAQAGACGVFRSSEGQCGSRAPVQADALPGLGVGHGPLLLRVPAETPWVPPSVFGTGVGKRRQLDGYQTPAKPDQPRCPLDSLICTSLCRSPVAELNLAGPVGSQTLAGFVFKGEKKPTFSTRQQGGKESSCSSCLFFSPLSFYTSLVHYSPK